MHAAFRVAPFPLFARGSRSEYPNESASFVRERLVQFNFALLYSASGLTQVGRFRA